MHFLFHLFTWSLTNSQQSEAISMNMCFWCESISRMHSSTTNCVKKI